MPHSTQHHRAPPDRRTSHNHLDNCIFILFGIIPNKVQFIALSYSIGHQQFSVIIGQFKSLKDPAP